MQYIHLKTKAQLLTRALVCKLQVVVWNSVLSEHFEAICSGKDGLRWATFSAENVGQLISYYYISAKLEHIYPERQQDNSEKDNGSKHMGVARVCVWCVYGGGGTIMTNGWPSYFNINPVPPITYWWIWMPLQGINISIGTNTRSGSTPWHARTDAHDIASWRNLNWSSCLNEGKAWNLEDHQKITVSSGCFMVRWIFAYLRMYLAPRLTFRWWIGEKDPVHQIYMQELHCQVLGRHYLIGSDMISYMYGKGSVSALNTFLKGFWVQPMLISWKLYNLLSVC